MFAFTLEDPTLSLALNGRDPLGTMAVWQHRARDLVPNLSSASRQAEGFQLLLTALAWWPEFARRTSLPASDLRRFFLLVEQAFARACRTASQDWLLPGTRRLNAGNEGLWISANQAHYLLDSPLVNGTWGLYLAPAIRSGLILENMRLASPALESEVRAATPEVRHLFDHLQPCMTGNGVEMITASRRHRLVQALAKTLADLPIRKKLRDTLVTPGTSPITTDLARLARRVPTDSPPQELIAQALHELPDHRTVLARVQRCERLLATVDAVFEFACAEDGAATLRELAAELPIDLVALASTMAGFSDSGAYSGLAEERVKGLRSISLDNKVALLRDLINQHEQLSKRRGNAAWITLADADRIERRVVLARPPANQLSPATAWRNDYYLVSLQQLAHRLQVRKA
ncbi:hypothetical protein LZ683_16495 [Comamonas testosteroni]|uniref:hypothetical protein n=1 Tax=Comamonas testosteroni TaxID=285 RepID=UPI0023AAC52E|nr:hypothetical protein [Comamonas testosteroni]WEE75757.1 hypothetical protein LZ683_16495 [Comamonas testosteroni]